MGKAILNTISFVILISNCAFAQTTISGIVKEPNSKTLEYVNVFLKDTADGGTTDSLGRFSFTTPEAGQHTVAASFIGYKTFERNVTLAGVDIVLTSDALLDSTTQKNEMAEVYCVMSMIKRGWVFINPMTYGREYGIASKKLFEKGKAIPPENPRILYLEAWEKYNAPKMWGGDKEEAKELLTLAIQTLERNPSTGIDPRWGKSVCEEILKLY